MLVAEAGRSGARAALSRHAGAARRVTADAKEVIGRDSPASRVENSTHNLPIWDLAPIHISGDRGLLTADQPGELVMSEALSLQISGQSHAPLYTTAVYFNAREYTTAAIPYDGAGSHYMPMRYLVGLQKLRKKRGLTQAQLAAMIGAEQPTIQRYEAGKRRPSIEDVVKLADALGATIGELFDEAAPPPNVEQLKLALELALPNAPANLASEDGRRLFAELLHNALVQIAGRGPTAPTEAKKDAAAPEASVPLRAPR